MDFDRMRVLPLLQEYTETNQFTLALALFLAACFAWGRIFKAPAALTGRRTALWLAAACLVGLGLRFAWVEASGYRPAFAWSDRQTQSKNLVEADGINIYGVMGAQGVWSIDERGKPTARRPIGYPVFMAGFYRVFGPTLPVYYGVTAALFAAMVAALYFLAREISGERAGVLAAWFYSLYPVSIYSFAMALDEHLFLPLWCFGIWLLFRHLKGRPVRFALLWYGLIFGISTATRTHSFFMPFVVACVYRWSGASWKKAAGAFLAVYAMALLTVLPWIIRNYKEWGAYVPYTATNHDVYHGCNPSVRSGDNNGHWPQPGEPGYNAALSQAISDYDVKEIQRLGAYEVRKYIFSRPVDFVVLGIEKWLHFLGTTRKTGVWAVDLIEESKFNTPEKKLAPAFKRFVEEAAFGAYYVLFYSFVAGLVLLARRWKRIDEGRRKCLLTLGLCFLLYLGVHFILYPERKYRFPLEPFMMACAAPFWLFLAREWKPALPFVRRPAGART